MIKVTFILYNMPQFESITIHPNSDINPVFYILDMLGYNREDSSSGYKFTKVELLRNHFSDKKDVFELADSEVTRDIFTGMISDTNAERLKRLTIALLGRTGGYREFIEVFTFDRTVSSDHKIVEVYLIKRS